MRKSLLLTAFLFPLITPAQTIRNAGSFIYTRLTAYSNVAADAFSFSGNTGALTTAPKFSAGVFNERRFGLKELSAYAAAAVLPTGSGTFGFRGDYLGGAAYNEASVGFAYGRRLGSNVSLGVQFNYFAMTATGYEAVSAINADAGVIIRLTPQLIAGVQTCNPVGGHWSKKGTEPLPAVYRAGLGYEASPQFFLLAEAEKVEENPLSINVGIHYLMAEKLVARAGLHSATAVYYLGFGVKLKNLRFDVTVSLHPYLGLTPGLLLLYAAAE